MTRRSHEAWAPKGLQTVQVYRCEFVLGRQFI